MNLKTYSFKIHNLQSSFQGDNYLSSENLRVSFKGLLNQVKNVRES